MNSDSPHAVLLSVDGAIGPAMLDYLGRSMAKAEQDGASLVIIQLDTPGGLVTTTREIISLILESPLPVAIHVGPQGARAASAGTYMIYAAHVASMAPATHLGAATPVRIGGGSSPLAPSPKEDGEGGGDERSKDGDDPASGEVAMNRKIISDAVAYIRSLAELRGRNADWAERAVRVGDSLTSAQALEENVVDFLVPNIADLLEAMDGRVVVVRDRAWTLSTSEVRIEALDPDWRTRLLAVLTDPNVAYILMILGIYGLIFEFSNPGSLVPGVVGAILLLLGLFALQLLPINFAGLALIALGVGLMVAEAFAPSFGAMGVGGVVAFVIGSIILIDTDVPAFELHWPIIAAFSIMSGVVFIAITAMALEVWKKPVVSGLESAVGMTAKVLEDFEEVGRVRFQGESWQARSTEPVRKGQRVKVTQAASLSLFIEPVSEPETENDNREHHES